MNSANVTTEVKLQKERSQLARTRASSSLRGTIQPLSGSGRQLTNEIIAESLKKVKCGLKAEVEVDEDFDTDIEIEEKSISPYDAYGIATYNKTCAKLGVTPIRYIERSLQFSDIVLKNRGIGPSGTLAIANALLVNTTITHLNLDGNGIGPKGAQYISWMLRENFNIHILSLNENNLGSTGAETLAEALFTNETITKLNISGNNFEDKDAEWFAEALERNRSLKELDLSYNNFGDKAAETLGPAIAANETLKVLTLTWNKFRPYGAIEIAKGVADNVMLKSLVISMNGLGTDGAKAFAEALRKNDTLLDLDISSNRITDDGATSVAKALETNETLRVLRIGQNPLTSASSVILLESIHSNENSALNTLDMTGVSVFKEATLTAHEIRETKPHFKFTYGGVVVSGSVGLDSSQRDAFFASKNPMTILKWYLGHKSLRMIDIFKLLDKNGDTKISREEFVNRMQALKIPLTQVQLDNLIEMLDKDGDDHVDLSEMIEGEKKWRRNQTKQQMKMQKRESLYNQSALLNT